MDQERWRKVEDVFQKALDLPEPEREAWLDRACREDSDLRTEVESLLASANTAEDFVGSRVEQAVLDLHEDETPKQRAMEGREVGAYRLIRELGRGGIAGVYLAERAHRQYES